MSATEPLPRILIIDDEEASQHLLGLDGLAICRSRRPSEVESSDLAWADLVLMDYILENWSDRDALQSISLKPSNGLALASVLREHVDTETELDGNYTAFAIHSAHIGEISRRLHTTNITPQVVARLNNLEWAFDKVDDSRFDNSAALARAVREISESWPDIENRGLKAAATDLLRLPDGTDWAARALDDIVLCQIPLSEFSAGSNRILFLRWLLHGILPYPTFLWAKQWVAARLRITPESLDTVIAGDSELARDLRSCQYNGVLPTFLGGRWWRAAIEQYSWGIRASGAQDALDFHRILEKRGGMGLDRVNESSPVVCVDKGLRAEDGLQGMEAVVRLVPDLWPAYADPAYAKLVAVREQAELIAIIHPLDRERLAIEPMD